jgi:hypothetical protein
VSTRPTTDFAPSADADPRHAQLVELAEQVHALFPEARTVEVHLIVPIPADAAPRDEADEWRGVSFYAPRYPRPPFVSIEERAPLGEEKHGV